MEHELPGCVDVDDLVFNKNALVCLGETVGVRIMNSLEPNIGLNAVLCKPNSIVDIQGHRSILIDIEV